MTLPGLSLSALPMASVPTAVLDFPLDGTFGATVSALLVLATGVAISSYLRTKRAPQPVPVPDSAAA